MMHHMDTPRPGPLHDVDRWALASSSCAALAILVFAVVPMRFAVALVPTSAVAAVVLGVLAVRRMGINGARGRGLATTGFLVGGIVLVLFVFLLVAGAIEGGAAAAGA